MCSSDDALFHGWWLSTPILMVLKIWVPPPPPGIVVQDASLRRPHSENSMTPSCRYVPISRYIYRVCRLSLCVMSHNLHVAYCLRRHVHLHIHTQAHTYTHFWGKPITHTVPTSKSLCELFAAMLSLPLFLYLSHMNW